MDVDVDGRDGSTGLALANTWAGASSGVPSITVREATEADNAGLLSLARGSVEGRGVRWTIERAPDFFAPFRAEPDGWRVVLAEDTADTCVGCISLAAREAYVQGHPWRTAYLSTFLVDPGYRHRGIGDELCRWAGELCRGIVGADGLVLAVIRDGNAHMRRRLSGPRGLPGLHRFAQVWIHSIPTRTLRNRGRGRDPVEVTTATPADIEEMAALAGRVFPERQFGPAFDLPSLTHWIAAAPGLGISDHLLAREKGALVGWLGLWDESVFRRARVAAYSRTVTLQKVIHDAFTPLTRALPLPKVGDVVGCVTIQHVCVPRDRPDVLRSLLADAGRRVHDWGCPWLRIALDPHDRLTDALGRMRTRVSSFGAYVTTPEGADTVPPLHGRPLHFEAALA